MAQNIRKGFGDSLRITTDEEDAKETGAAIRGFFGLVFAFIGYSIISGIIPFDTPLHRTATIITVIVSFIIGGAIAFYVIAIDLCWGVYLFIMGGEHSATPKITQPNEQASSQASPLSPKDSKAPQNSSVPQPESRTDQPPTPHQPEPTVVAAQPPQAIEQPSSPAPVIVAAPSVDTPQNQSSQDLFK